MGTSRRAPRFRSRSCRWERWWKSRSSRSSRNVDRLHRGEGKSSLSFAPADVAPNADIVEMRVGIENETFRVDLHALRFKPLALHAGQVERHLGAEAAIGAYDAMPRQQGRLTFRQRREHRADMQRNHIHMHGNAAIRGELTRRNQGHEA